LGPGVQRLAKETGWGSMVLTKSSCRPLLGVTVWRRIEPGFEADCAAFMNAAYEKVRRDPDVKTVVLVGAWSGPFEPKWGEYYVSSARDPHDVTGASMLLRQGLERSVRSLTAAGKDVVVMGDTPLWKFDPAKVALTSSLPVRLALATGLQGHVDAFGYDRSAGVEPRNAQVDEIMRSISRMDRTQYIDLFPRFCDAKRCLFHSQSDLLFVDASHLSPAGATLALGTLVLAPAIPRDVDVHRP
ncbi:MAG: SGNH hydrolase domain-containing protein, partial [Phenylobacterium sp.]